MGAEQEFINALNNLQDVVEKSKAGLRGKLMAMSKEERFRVLREDLSLKGIEALCEWALSEEDYEICASVKDVKASNISTFKLRFSLNGNSSNKALVTKFKWTNGKIHYHADYLLDDSEEGALVMLYKNDEGVWTSEWASNNRNMFLPIGEAIDTWEEEKS